MKRSATQAHFTHLCRERHGDQKKFWRTLKPYVNSRKNVDVGQTIVLKDNKQIIREQQQVCETLNEFFTNISRTVKANMKTRLDTPDLFHITKIDLMFQIYLLQKPMHSKLKS